MSRHPVDAVSLGFGLVFLAMALVGLGEAADVVSDGLVMAVVAGVVAAAVVGIAVAVRGLTGYRPRQQATDGPRPVEEMPVEEMAADVASAEMVPDEVEVGEAASTAPETRSDER